MSSSEDDAYRMLQASTKKHRMTILREDGVYRHVRFHEPGTSIWHFDLVTWPGHLVITGDLQDYHFARVHDMFEFFRTKRPGEINASYWAEKLVGHHQKFEEYSFDRFKESLVQHFLWSRESIPEGRSREVWKAIREEILGAEGVEDSQDLAYKAASEFWFKYDPKEWGRYGHGHGFGFTDVYDWHWKDYDYHFLVSLHAIVWGIHQWDTVEHKTDADWLREENKKLRDEVSKRREGLVVKTHV